MKTKAFMVKKLFFVFLIVFCFTGVSFSEPKQEFDLSIPFGEGIQAEKNKDYEKAIESFRKVLFVDGTNAEAQFRLADSFLKLGNEPKAYKEFKYFLEMAPDDSRLSATKKKKWVAFANDQIAKIKSSPDKASLLGFTDWNILIITFLLFLTFLIKFVRWYLERHPQADPDIKKVKKVFKDNYLEEHQDRVIDDFDPNYLTITMFLLLLVFCFLSARILINLF